jgi:hypothetical protein
MSGGKHFIPFQEVRKNLRDTVYQEVTAWRYKCVGCGRTFRVYPPGVQAAYISQRVKGMAVMLYLLGLSYGAVVLMLDALGGLSGQNQRVSQCAGHGRACAWDETERDIDWLSNAGIGSRPDQRLVQWAMAADWGDGGSNQWVGLACASAAGTGEY